MGFFGRKKTILVSSTVYNMAGEEENRPDFLKNTVYAAIMSPHNPWLGSTISNNLLTGPGMDQRKYFNYCVRQNYPGLPVYSVTRERPVSMAVLGGEIPTPGSPAGLQLSMQSANLVVGDYEWIVEQYVLLNNPENYDTEYVSNYDPTLNEITIQWFGGGSVTFSAGSYGPDKSYVIGEYYHYLPTNVQSLVTGSTTVGDLTKPSTAGYGLDGSSNRGVTNYPMNYDERVITTYTAVPTLPSDTNILTTGLSDSPGFDGLDETWSKITYEGGDGNTEETISREHFLEIYEYRQVYTANVITSTVVNENTPAAGQTETIVTWREGDNLRPVFDWRIDTQDSLQREMVGGVLLFSYEIGTGNATLDALQDDATIAPGEGEYFPFMPIRLDGESITHVDYDDITGSGLYEKTNRAYRRASGGAHRFSKLVDQVEDNADIDDIDFAFIHHGVAINVIEPACRAYMYIWLKNVSDHQFTSSSYMATYSGLVSTYVAQVAAYNSWIFDQGDSGRPQYGDPPPVKPSLDSLEVTTVQLAPSADELNNVRMRLGFVNITETLHSGAPTNPDTGLAAIEGEIWLQDGTDLTWDVTTGVYPNAYTKNYNVEQLEMYWQTGANSYKKLIIWGLVHENVVYGGVSVLTTGKEGLAETDPSGFIVPLHYGTMKDMGLKDATQMATANTNIIFNTYTIVKQKWYQTFIGMVIIFIVIIVLTVVTGGLAAGPSAGLLGTNAAVGAAIGLTGTAAILAGAIINALVAIAVSQIISYGSVAIFGDKWGAVIAAVINLAITMGASGGFDVGNLTELLSTENIMAMTSAIANGYQGYTAGAVAEIGDKMEQNQEKFEEDMDELQKMLVKLRGNSGLIFDPLSLTDSVKGNDRSIDGMGYVIETLDQFIHRTTMTGSDIVEINLTLVKDFAALSLELP